MKTAVVGHVEWATFARVDHVPAPGEIVHGEDVFDVPAGGGPVAAMQLLKLAGECTFFTALGDDELGHRAYDELNAMGLRVEAIFRSEPQRRAFVHTDAQGERTITVLGPRLGPHGDDPLPWDELHETDAVYFCAGDDEALRRARRGRVLVATTRERERLERVRLPLDVAIGSARDEAERFAMDDFDPSPRIAVWTGGRSGGTYATRDGRTGRYAAAEPPGPVVDAYGAGDSFAACLALALARGDDVVDALNLAARCGAACMTGRGPYEGQLSD